jgi:hypothetical protein
MFGTSPRVNQLEAHKKLLIAESELNRAQLIEDMTALREDVSELARRAKSMTSIAVVAAALVTGVVAVRRRKPADPANPKPSWLQGALKGASLVSNLWHSFRSNGHEQKESQRKSL